MTYIILVASAVIIATALIIDARADRELERRTDWFASAMMPHEKFSLAEYYEQIERVQTELLQEREREPKHEIVLWWGLDGCKIDGDGNIVWISKRRIERDYADLCNCYEKIYTVGRATPYYEQIANAVNANDATNIAQQIQALEAEQYKLRLQAAKAAQNARIIENIKSLQEVVQ